MIKTVIFDIGNVLTDFRWEEYIREFGFDEETVQKVAKATAMTQTWYKFDKGVVSFEEVLKEFISNDPSVEKEIRIMCENMSRIVTKVDYAIPWVKSLKEKGYQVLVLSNFSEKAWQDCQDALGFMSYTDGGIVSYLHKCIKPEPDIYQLIIGQYNLVPEECVFIDDLQKNLDAAAEFGINTILFQSYMGTVEELKKLGVS